METEASRQRWREVWCSKRAENKKDTYKTLWSHISQRQRDGEEKWKVDLWYKFEAVKLDI